MEVLTGPRSDDPWDRVPKVVGVEYYAYLRSDAWRQRRRLVLDRAGHRCQVCGATSSLEVHHNTYERLGHESPFDLVALCRDCHSRYHETSKIRADSMGQILLGIWHGAEWSLEVVAFLVGVFITFGSLFGLAMFLFDLATGQAGGPP